MPLCIWRGPKIHRRLVAILGTEGKSDGKILNTKMLPIRPGETFEATEKEMASFRDNLEVIGAGLPTSSLSRDSPLGHTVNPALTSLVRRAHAGEATGDEKAIVGEILAFLDAHAHGQTTPDMEANLAQTLEDFALPLFL